MIGLQTSQIIENQTAYLDDLQSLVRKLDMNRTGTVEYRIWSYKKMKKI
jgi:hypothetical protein